MSSAACGCIELIRGLGQAVREVRVWVRPDSDIRDNGDSTQVLAYSPCTSGFGWEQNLRFVLDGC